MSDEPYKVTFAHNGRRAARSFSVAKDIIARMASECKFKLEITEMPCQELKQLEDKLAEAKRDSERWDHLEKMKGDISFNEGRWHFVRENEYFYRDEGHKTTREAIDAAMKEEK